MYDLLEVPNILISVGPIIRHTRTDGRAAPWSLTQSLRKHYHCTVSAQKQQKHAIPN